MLCIHCKQSFEPRQRYCSAKCRTYHYRNGNVTVTSNATITQLKEKKKAATLGTKWETCKHGIIKGVGICRLCYS